MFFEDFVLTIRDKDINYFEDLKNLRDDYGKSLDKKNISEIIQFLEFNELSKVVNFLYETKSVEQQSITEKIDKILSISQKFDNAHISCRIYAYFLSSAQKLFKKINNTEYIKWVDPRDDYNLSGNMLTLGFGAYNDEYVKFDISNGVLRDSFFNQSFVKLPKQVNGFAPNCLGNNHQKNFAIILPNDISKLSPGCFANSDSLSYAILSKNLTEIPERCFYGDEKLHGIIAESVKCIGKYAFSKTNISSLSLINQTKVTTVADFAFYSCKNLRGAYLINSNIGKGAFGDCSNLNEIAINIDKFNGSTFFRDLFIKENVNLLSENLYFPKKVIAFTNLGVIPDNFFRDCKDVEKIIIKGQVKKIGSCAFAHCENLNELDIDYIGDEIPEGCFAFCSSLKNLPNFSNVSRIQRKAFTGCINLECASMGKTVTELGESCFSNCCTLQFNNINFNLKVLPKNSFENCIKLNVKNILENCKELQSFSLKGCTFDQKFDIPETLEIIEPNAFGNEPQKVNVLKYDGSVKTINNLKGIFNGIAPTTLILRGLDFTKSLNLNDEDGLMSLFSNSAARFNQTIQLENVMLSDCKLSKNLFKNNTTIKKVILNGINYIPDSCFENCSELEAIKLDCDNAVLGSYCFKNAHKLKNFYTKEREDFDYVDVSFIDNFGANCFEGCSSIKCAKINDKINKNIFKDCCSLSQIMIDFAKIDFNNDGKSILNLLFDEHEVYNSKIYEVDLFNTKKILPYLFMNCFSIGKVYCNYDIEEIGDHAFDGFGDFSKVEIKFVGQELKAGALKDCFNINVENILKNVTKFSDYSLYNSKILGSLNLKDTLFIGENVFVNSNIKVPTFTLSSEISLKKNSLNGLSFDCLEINDLSLLEKNNCQLFELFNSNQAEFSNFCNIDFANINVKTLPERCFENWASLKKVKALLIEVLPEKVFKGCSSLEALVLNTELEEISTEAFAGCQNLVRINSSKEEDMSRVYLPNCKTIKDGAFTNCEKIEFFDFPSLTKICKNVFYGCLNIKKVKLGMLDSSALNKFKEYFNEDSNSLDNQLNNLEMVELGFASSIVPKSYFENCDSLKEIVLKGEIKELGEFAFSGCDNLEKIAFNFTGKVLSNGVFRNCTKLNLILDFSKIECLGEYALTGVNLSYEEMSTILNNVKVFNSNCLLNVNVTSEDDELMFDKLVISEDKKYYKGIFAFYDFKEIIIEAANVHSYDGTLISFFDLFGNENLSVMSLSIRNSIKVSELKEILARCGALNTIIIDYELESESEDLFAGLENLENVIFTYKINSIGRGWFKNSRKLKRIKIADFETNQLDSVEVVGDEAFLNCESLETIFFRNLEQSGVNIFNGCTGLKHLLLNSNIFTEQKTLKSIFNTLDISQNFRIDLIADEFLPAFFDGAKNISEIHIVGTINEIEENAFRNCCSLKALELDFKGNTIPDRCFENCYELQNELNFPSVYKIGNDAFKNCHSLININFSNLISVGESAFEECKSLTTKFVLSCSEIGAFAFKNNTSITSIEFTEKFKYGTDAFSGCENIAEISLINIIDSTIGKSFPDSTKLKTIIFEDATINNAFFANLSSLETIIFKNEIKNIGNFAFFNSTNLSAFPSLENICSIGAFAFKNTKIRTAVINSEAEYIGPGIFAGCSCLEDLTAPLIQNNFSNYFGIDKPNSDFYTSVTPQYNKNGAIIYRSYEIPSSLKNIRINKLNNIDGALAGLRDVNLTIDCIVDQIPNFCFYKFYGTLDIGFATLIKSIGDYSFAFTEFDSFKFNNLEKIGNYAFFEAKSPVILDLGDKIRSLSNTFYLENNVKEISLKENAYYKMSEGFLISKEENTVIFVNSSLNSDVIIPTEVLTLPRRIFANHSEILTLDTNNVEIIKEEVFKDCCNLINVKIGNSVNFIDKEILAGCNSINKIELPFVGSSQYICEGFEYLFGTTKLSSLYLTINGGYINKNTFKNNCTKFEVLDIHNLKQRLFGENVFCDLILKRLILSSNLEKISAKTFLKTLILSIESNNFEVENGMLLQKGTLIYYYSGETNPIFIDKNINKIESEAFASCNEISDLIINTDNIDLNYAFSKFSIQNLSVYERDDLISQFRCSFDSLDKLILFGAQSLPSNIASFKNLSELELFNLSTLKAYTFDFLPNSVKHLHLNKIENILPKAFSKTDNTKLSLDSLVIESVDNINSAALNDLDCKQLIIKDSPYFSMKNNLLIDLRNDAIIYCNKEITNDSTIESDAKIIENYVFSNIKSKVNFSFPNIQKVGDFAFTNCEQIGYIVFGDTLEEVGLGIFKNSHVSKLNIPFIGSSPKNLTDISYMYNELENSSVDNGTLIEICLTQQFEIFAYFKNFKNLSKLVLQSKNACLLPEGFAGCYRFSEIALFDTANVPDFAFLGSSDYLRIRIKGSKKKIKNLWGKNFDVLKENSTTLKILSLGLSKYKRANLCFESD